MSVDPTDPDTFEANDEDAELDEETPEADAAEQKADVRRRGAEPQPRVDPDKANEADAAEQARTVPLDEDEDDYR